MQTWPLPQNWPNMVFGPKICAILKPMKNNFPIFEKWSILYKKKYLKTLTKINHQKWPKKIVRKNAQCSETYEKTIFWFLWFLFSVKWSILSWKFLENRPQCYHKCYCEKFCSRLDQNAFQKILKQWEKKIAKENFIKFRSK